MTVFPASTACLISRRQCAQHSFAANEAESLKQGFPWYVS